eukprot:scaffold130644_cov57-Phaeocystis_antarctica.AAC.3
MLLLVATATSLVAYLTKRCWAGSYLTTATTTAAITTTHLTKRCCIGSSLASHARSAALGPHPSSRMYECASKLASSACTAAHSSASHGPAGASSSAKRAAVGASKRSEKEQLQCASRAHTTSIGMCRAAATDMPLASARSRLPRPYCTWTIRWRRVSRRCSTASRAFTPTASTAAVAAWATSVAGATYVRPEHRLVEPEDDDQHRHHACELSTRRKPAEHPAPTAVALTLGLRIDHVVHTGIHCGWGESRGCQSTLWWPSARALRTRCPARVVTRGVF